MSLTKIEFEGNTWSQIQCDDCHEILTNHDGHNLMPDELAIQNMADEYGWASLSENHFCGECHEYDDDGELIIYKPELL